MRYFCVAVLLAWTVGSAEVFVAGPQSAGGQKGTEPREQPLTDVPQEFRFLFLSPEQRMREEAKRPTYWEDLWKGLPYDSISLERGSTGGCLYVCSSSTVTLYRATIAGSFNTFAGLRGRAPGVLVDQSGAPERHRRGDPRRV